MENKLHLIFNSLQQKSKLIYGIIIYFFLAAAKLSAQCASNATSTADEDIFNVTFGTLNNTSNCIVPSVGPGSILNQYANYAYVGFPGGVPNADRGCTIPFSVQVGTCGGNYSNSLAIFIDWNNDADFIDAGEKVYMSASSTTGAHTETGNITVPLTATLGQCKMRIVNVETSTPSSINPCGTYSWGETEDYFINVTNGGGVGPYINGTVNQVVTGSVSQCAVSQQIICIPVLIGAGCTAGNLTQFQLGAGSSTNLLSDVSKIHIFYTGLSNVYTPTNEFVTGGTMPAGSSNTINGSQALFPNDTNFFWVTYDMNSASTIGNLIDGSCTQISIDGVNQIPAATNPVGSGTITNCPCSFSLGNDVTLCTPFTYTLNGPSGFDSYLWSPGGATTQNLTVNTAGSYTCTATIINGGLVTNGDFNAGNTGFSTSYALGTGGPWGPVSSPGTYSITTNPNLAHSNFYSFGDHTSGTGNMMVCNGSDIANTVVWSQTITVTPNTNYNFSAWVASVENTTSEAQLQFSINGNLIGPVVSAPLTGGVWLNFFVNWNSASNTSAVIKIVDQSTEPAGNDFALDDITFERVCSFSDIITINAGSTATVSVPANITVCNSTSIAASSFTSSTAGVTYTWTNSNTTIGLAASGSGDTPIFTATNTGSSQQTAIISVTPAVGGCIGTPNDFTITVNPTPNITLNNPTICTGGTATLIANGATNYTWSSNAGSATTSSVTVSPTGNTTYTVTGESLGCIFASTTTVNVTPSLAIGLTNAVLCSGSSTVLTASGANNYTWSANANGATTSTVQVSPTITTTYSVMGESSGCTGSNTVTVTVNPIPTVTANSSTICAGNSSILTAGGTATSYSWSNGATNTTSINVSPASTTNYTLTGSSMGCTASYVSTVTVNPSISVNIIPTTICEGSTGTLTAVPSSGGGTFTWTPGGENSSTIVNSPNSTATYSVLYALNGCTATAIGNINLDPNPVVILNASNTNLTLGEMATITASGGGTYVWSTGSSNSSISVTPLLSTSYCATVTSVAGCSSEQCILIEVIEKSSLTIPNVFTPNGDNVNDVFFIDSHNISSFDLQIFNRWGQLLFSADAPSKGWDGKTDGTTVPDGTYMYILKAKGADNTIYDKQGTINVFQ